MKGERGRAAKEAMGQQAKQQTQSNSMKLNWIWWFVVAAAGLLLTPFRSNHQLNEIQWRWIEFHGCWWAPFNLSLWILYQLIYSNYGYNIYLIIRAKWKWIYLMFEMKACAEMENSNQWTAMEQRQPFHSINNFNCFSFPFQTNKLLIPFQRLKIKEVF